MATASTRVVMGRVVKNARVNTQRYQVAVPQVDRPVGSDEGAIVSLAAR